MIGIIDDDLVRELLLNVKPSPDETIIRLRVEIERLRAALKSCPCPGGGWNGMPKDTEPTIENCLAHNACGCDLGAALGIDQQQPHPPHDDHPLLQMGEDLRPTTIKARKP